MLILFLSLLSLSLKIYAAQDYSRFFLDQKGDLTQVEEWQVEPRKYQVRLHSSQGFTVEGFVKVPDPPAKQAPAVIILDGLETGAWVVDLIGGVEEVNDTVIMAMNYPYKGEISLEGIQLLATLLKFRRAIFETVVGGLLMVDYLSQRGDVDPEGIVMVGISFGSPFAVVTSALDSRVKALAVHYGGGDLEQLLFHNLRSENWILRRLFSRLGALILAPVEPLEYVERISPRPLLMINGRQDERIPLNSVQALFQKAGPPKQLIWLEGDHVYPSKKELIQELTRRTARWMRSNNLFRTLK